MMRSSERHPSQNNKYQSLNLDLRTKLANKLNELKYSYTMATTATTTTAAAAAAAAAAYADDNTDDANKLLGQQKQKKKKKRRRVVTFERLICKNGTANINRENIESMHRKYISDLFNTIVDAKWRYLLLMFVLSFVLSWLAFAGVWYLTEKSSMDNCVAQLANTTFMDAILFSIETQQTIGYGYKYITGNCNFTLIILMVQCGFGVVLESFMGGIVFAKLSRPKKRTETLIFSKNACIAKRDGTYTFMCRVGDMRKTHIISAYVSMYLIKTRYTAEGEVIPWNARKLKSVADDEDCSSSSNRLIFMPTIVEHKIDATSPLYELVSFEQNESNHSQKSESMMMNKFRNRHFEIVVILEGTVESTGATTQARTSYLPSEILWDHVFQPLICEISYSDRSGVNRKSRKATIDFSKFDAIRKLEDPEEEKVVKTMPPDAAAAKYHQPPLMPSSPADQNNQNNNNQNHRDDYSLEKLFSIQIRTPAPTIISDDNLDLSVNQLITLNDDDDYDEDECDECDECDESTANNHHHYHHHHHHHQHQHQHQYEQQQSFDEENVHTIDLNKFIKMNSQKNASFSCQDLFKKLNFDNNNNNNHHQDQDQNQKEESAAEMTIYYSKADDADVENNTTNHNNNKNYNSDSSSNNNKDADIRKQSTGFIERHRASLANVEFIRDFRQQWRNRRHHSNPSHFRTIFFESKKKRQPSEISVINI